MKYRVKRGYTLALADKLLQAGDIFEPRPGTMDRQNMGTQPQAWTKVIAPKPAPKVDKAKPKKSSKVETTETPHSGEDKK